MEKLLTVRIGGDLHQKVKLATVASGTTIAAVVRAALEDFAAKHPAGRSAAKGKAKAKKPVAKSKARKK